MRQDKGEHFKLSTRVSIIVFTFSRAAVNSAANLNREKKVIHFKIKEEIQQFSVLRNQKTQRARYHQGYFAVFTQLSPEPQETLHDCVTGFV